MKSELGLGLYRLTFESQRVSRFSRVFLGVVNFSLGNVLLPRPDSRFTIPMSVHHDRVRRIAL